MHARLRFNGAWNYLAFSFQPYLFGEWGIRANITYAGANATYNVYRDNILIASDLTSSNYIDQGLINNQTYSYSVSASYADGGESDKISPVEVTPFSDTVRTHNLSAH